MVRASVPRTAPPLVSASAGSLRLKFVSNMNRGVCSPADFLQFFLNDSLELPGGQNGSRHKGVFQGEGERGVRRSARALSCCIPRAAKILMIFNIDSNLIFSVSPELQCLRVLPLVQIILMRIR